MKTKIIYLGILTAMFINSSFAKTVTKEQQNSDSNFIKEESVSGLNLVSDTTLKKPSMNFELSTNEVKSITVLSSNYEKPINEIIEEDKKIIESPEEIYQPLYLDTTIQDIIKLNNEIIESPITNEVHPLDFNMVKKVSIPTKNENISSIIHNKSAIKS